MQESRVDVNDSCMCLIYAKVDVSLRHDIPIEIVAVCA